MTNNLLLYMHSGTLTLLWAFYNFLVTIRLTTFDTSLFFTLLKQYNHSYCGFSDSLLPNKGKGWSASVSDWGAMASSIDTYIAWTVWGHACRYVDCLWLKVARWSLFMCCLTLLHCILSILRASREGQIEWHTLLRSYVLRFGKGEVQALIVPCMHVRNTVWLILQHIHVMVCAANVKLHAWKGAN